MILVELDPKVTPKLGDAQSMGSVQLVDMKDGTHQVVDHLKRSEQNLADDLRKCGDVRTVKVI
jgi:hypothetical protein